jgi:predicted PurR-regulated permease PerM
MAPRKGLGGSKFSLQNIRITTDTIFRFILIVLAIVAAFYLRQVVVIVLVALLLAALIDPFADRLQKYRFPRGLSVAVVYLVIASILSGVALLVVPPTVEQGTDLVNQYLPFVTEFTGNDPLLVAAFDDEFTVTQIWQAIQESGVSDAVPEIINILSGAMNAVAAIILILILAFYMVIEEQELKREVVQWVTPAPYRDFVIHVMPKIKVQIGKWLRGQLILMLAVGGLVFIGLSILGLPFALILAVVAGLLEVIPFLGPNLAMIPAVVIGLSVSPMHAIFVLIIYFVIQQIEADVLTPKIMQRVAGLNPVLSIVAILVGFEVAGIVGGLLAIPFAMIISVFVKEWASYRQSSK